MSFFVVENTCNPEVVGRLAAAADVSVVWMSADISTAARYSTVFGPSIGILTYCSELVVPPQNTPLVSSIKDWEKRGISPGLVSYSPKSALEFVRYEILENYLGNSLNTMVIAPAEALPFVHMGLTDNQGTQIVIHPGRSVGVAAEYRFMNNSALTLFQQIQ
jgi:hypothetical protein